MPNALISLFAAASLALAPAIARGSQVAQPAASPDLPPVTDTALGGAGDPDYARDGRLAVAVRGDIWVQDRAGAGARWLRLTSGAAWDREPAWSADGQWVTFSSDRAGGFDLWRVRAGAAGDGGEPERLTTSDEPEGEPAVATDGRTIFVRGRGPTARLWVREPDGAERRLTGNDAAERWPAFSPDGGRVAYVTLGERGSRLRVRTLSPEHDTVLVSDRAAERPAWAPDGDRIAFTVATGRGGVYVTTTDGGAPANVVVERHAAPAWSPDGATLALAGLPPRDVGYNGDPDRLGDRGAGALLSHDGRLWLVAAPAPMPSLVPLAVPAVADRERHNAQAFDAVWSRTAKLYLSDSSAARRRAEWETLRDSYRPRALAARSDLALEGVIHRLLGERPPLRESASGRAAVSSAHPVATEAGLEMLREGGNVVDAAVAVSFALGVVEPDASGVGGYGQMLLFTRGMREPKVIEFMARVPEKATLDNGALLRDGRLPDHGPVLAIVPGTVAAMHLAWKEHGSGKLEWAALIEPAIRAARDGYVVSEGLATTLATEREHFLEYPGSRELFFRDGEPLHAGDTVRNPGLQWTLEQIAKGGADAFYRGEVGRRMVADLRAQGNVMSVVDMARYFAVERDAVGTTYRGHAVYSSAPPVSGGATLAAQLNLLEQFADPRPYADDAATLHAMVSAWQLVPSSRGRIADPGLWPVRLEPFTSKDTARARWRCFDPSSALTARALRGDSLSCASPPAAGGGDAPR
ncbi:MAG: gamma-glutamyltransferase, partial [Gemmatimonadaceae bacterium]